MYIISSTPFTCCSSGTAMVRATVSASAPGYVAITRTVGGVMSGYWATGSVLIVSTPASSITTARTMEKIGRSMKNLENMALSYRDEETGLTVMPSRTLSIAEVTYRAPGSSPDVIMRMESSAISPVFTGVYTTRSESLTV